MTDNIESSGHEVLVECSSLSPLERTDLQAFLERQPEVRQVTRRLHLADAVLKPDALGLIAPRFDLVVHLSTDDVSQPPTEVGAIIVRKISEWREANRPRQQSSGDAC